MRETRHEWQSYLTHAIEPTRSDLSVFAAKITTSILGGKSTSLSVGEKTRCDPGNDHSAGAGPKARPVTPLVQSPPTHVPGMKVYP